MSWPLLVGVVCGLGFALAVAVARRAALGRMRRTVLARERAVRQGSDKAQLQHPVVDLSRCLGCGTCVDVCPEEGVLELVHGQAVVVNGTRCMGHAACERECPVGAITVTIANLHERTDVPALDDGLEAVGAPGLFLAGEVTVHALIKTAIDHGTAVAAEVARRVRDGGGGDGGGAFDLVIVGAGPAGLACALEAQRLGLRYVALDQGAGPGGTVAKYPRRKLVMTRPVELPLHGRLPKTTYTKEELIELWQAIAARNRLAIRYGETCEAVERDGAGGYVVRTGAHAYPARHVCLAVGRRGTPKRLGVPGEELPKVAYSLLDAHSYEGRRVLVVGGGDTAVEAAIGLAAQRGTEVTLAYRKDAFFRINARNEQRLEHCVAEGRLEVLFGSEVRAIRPDAVELEVRNGAGRVPLALPNDDVFVMAGGRPPFALLEQAGVSFDPSLRPAPAPPAEQGTGLVRALAAGFLLSVAALVWALLHLDYYRLPDAARAAHDKHALLHPARGAGLWLGIGAAALIVLNLLYLLRRAQRIRLGSLRLWMTAHVATGILALLCALLHGAMRPGDSPGGHALWALAVLLLTGAVGRYLYAYVPRAANGRELELVEVRAALGRVEAEWDSGQRRFRERAHEEVEALVDRRQWRGSFVGRLLALVGVERRLRRLLQRLAREGRDGGVPEDHVAETLELARRAHRTALMAAHYEDLRALLATWRYLHRWVALLLVLLVAVHVVHALLYGALFLDGGATG